MGGEVLPIRDIVREPAAGKSTYHKASIGEAARGISRSHIGNSSAGPHYINHRTSAPISQSTLPGDCHGATNTVASRNDIIAQRAFYNGASARYARLRNEIHVATLGMT